MENNNYGVKDVVELYVFDENSDLVTVLDNLIESEIVSNEESDYIFVKNALLNIDLLRFQQNSQDEKKDDYKTILNHIKGVPVVINRNNKNKKCKLIAKSMIRNAPTSEDEWVYYEIPSAEITNRFEVVTNNCEPSAFDTLFKILPSENGDLFTIHGLK